MVDFLKHLDGDGPEEVKIVGNPIDLTKPLTVRVSVEREIHDTVASVSFAVESIEIAKKYARLVAHSPELLAIVTRYLNPHQTWGERLADRKRAKEIIEELEA